MNTQQCENYLLDVLAGKTKGLQCIYEEYHHAVYALASSVVKNQYSAEDITQEVFIKIWKNANQYKFGSNPKAWILGITRNLSIDFLRKVKNETLNDIVEPYINTYEDPVADSILGKAELEYALKRLSDIERQIFVMHVIGDNSYLTISHTINIPLATVAFKGLSSIKKLRKIINDFRGGEKSDENK